MFLIRSVSFGSQKHTPVIQSSGARLSPRTNLKKHDVDLSSTEEGIVPEILSVFQDPCNHNEKLNNNEGLRLKNNGFSAAEQARHEVRHLLQGFFLHDRLCWSKYYLCKGFR